MNDPRFSIMEAAHSNDENKIDAASEATGLPLVGIVDEEEGGIIGYVSASCAEDMIERLNYPI